MDRNGLRGNIAAKEHVLNGAIHSNPKELAGKIPGSLEFHYSGSGSESIKPQSKEVTPTMEKQVVLPDTGYNYLSQVTVAAIPYSESDNSAGGITVTIG